MTDAGRARPRPAASGGGERAAEGGAVRRARLALAIAAGAVAAGLLAPATASAHGLVGKQDLPIPRWLFAWAAALVLIASFIGLAYLWPKPRLQVLRERVVARVPRFLGPLCGAIGVAVFGIVVYAGLEGAQTPVTNITPTFVYVTFWVGIPFLSCLVGDVFRAFNPWRAIARAAGFLTRRFDPPEPLPYPSWLGRWPAALGILIFAWVELVYANRDDPSTLAEMGLAYAAVQLLGMALYGSEPWLRKADAFGVYFGLFARLAPLHWTDNELRVRRPLEGVVSLDTPPGTVALLVIMIGTTSFDGFSQGEIWSSTSPHLQNFFSNLGFGPETSLELGYTVGLLCVVLFVGGIYRLGVLGMRSAGEDHDANELARLFVHSLVPIALAYVVAHYFSLLVYQSQAAVALASDPLGRGSDLFGTAHVTINYNAVSASAVWYVQVAALIIGHVCALVLAHDRAVAIYRSSRAAAVSQYWMLAVMVGFTSLGLWILSAAGNQ